MNVKICGITRLNDAFLAAEFGASMIGLNFYKPSPRYLDPIQAAALVAELRHQLAGFCPVMVGVFVNAPVHEILNIMQDVGLDFAQLSGDESDALLHELRGKAFKGIRPQSQAIALEDAAYYAPTFCTDTRAPSILLDAYHPKFYGGTGETASVDVALAVKAQVPRLMLAGGLTPENVGARVQAIAPWGVDVASGVEPDGQPGIKDAAKMQAFIHNAKNLL
ncbi:MAG: phosphoribosylanthranilate isomerase [Phototrophicaceae bacterium]|jgi:phosphoribosylanthranilate isomerase